MTELASRARAHRGHRLRRLPVETFRAEPLEHAHYLVLACLGAIISIRFFTEELHVLPRSANFIDIPLLLILGGAAVITTERATDAVQNSTFLTFSVLFLLIGTVSTIVNLQRINIYVALTFFYGFLGPIAYYLAVYRLWKPGRVYAISNLLISLALVQFVTIVFFDLPKFIRNRNPDAVSGTFGTNAYQLVFFLLIFVALVVGIVTFEPASRVRFIALPFLAAAFLAAFLAQYRTLLVTFAVTTLFVGYLVSRRQRGLFIAAAAFSLLIIALVVTLAYVPTNKFNQAIDAVHSDPAYFIDSRLGPADDVYHLYGDYWAFPLVGSGPGTYSSRAWNTFSGFQSASESNVAGPLVSRLIGGKPYETDVSDKYVVPRLEERWQPRNLGRISFHNHSPATWLFWLKRGSGHSCCSSLSTSSRSFDQRAPPCDSPR